MSHRNEYHLRRIALKHLRERRPTDRYGYHRPDHEDRLPWIRREGLTPAFSTPWDAAEAARADPRGTHYRVFRVKPQTWYRYESGSLHRHHDPADPARYRGELLTRSAHPHRVRVDVAPLEDAERRDLLAMYRRRVAAHDWRRRRKDARRAERRLGRRRGKAECRAYLDGDELRAERLAHPTCGLRPLWW